MKTPSTVESAAIAARHAPFVAAVEAFAAEQLSPEEIGGAKAAAAIMAMNNVYYRALHLVENDEYAQLRKQTLWTIVLKFLAVTTAKQNAAFWGPCSPDVTDEQAKMLADSKTKGFVKA